MLRARERVNVEALKLKEATEELNRLQGESSIVEKQLREFKIKCDAAKANFGHADATTNLSRKMQSVRYMYKVYASNAAQEAALKSIFYVAKTKRRILDAENEATNALKTERARELEKLKHAKSSVLAEEEKEEQNIGNMGATGSVLSGNSATGGMTGF